MTFRNQILTGDAFGLVWELPEGSIDTVWSSPPYWQMREYPDIGGARPFGSEETIEGYVASTVELFKGIRNCLKPWGTVWWNVGDTYVGCDKQRHGRKNLGMVPFMVADALQSEGWILRNIVSWVKSVTLPDPTKDRLPTSWEPILLLAHPDSGGKYFFDMDAIRQPTRESRHPMGSPPRDNAVTRPHHHKTKGHFAAQSTEIIHKYLRATLPKRVCRDNGKPIYEVTTGSSVNWGDDWKEEADRTWRRADRSGGNTGLKNRGLNHEREWTTTLVNGDCEGGSVPGIVLDPFMGSGTTGLVANQMGADFVGIEASAEGAEAAKRRIMNEPVSLFRDL